VAKLYRRCLVDLRIKELKRLRKELSPKEYSELKSAIYILRKNNEFISKKEKIELEKLFKYTPLLKAAYKFCKKLTIIFNTKHKKKTAEKKINDWIASVELSHLTCFNTFLSTLKKFNNEISNYFLNRNTSGFVEGLNNKLKVIKRRCYGIFDIKHFFQRIFIDLTSYAKLSEKQSVMHY